MGKTKIKVIDASQPEVEKKKASKKAEKQTIEDRKSKVVVEDRESKIEEKEKVHPQPSTIKKPSSTIHHPSSKKVRSKKYQQVIKDLDRTKSYTLPEAVDMVKKLSYAKFNATLEAHINTAQTGLRGLVSLPYASGKKLRILAFGKGAEQSGADLVGTDEIIERISQGKVDFDLIITTPEWMPKLAKVAKILGPKGLMPNPKNGTITPPAGGSADGLKKAIEGFQAGKTEYKTESKAPVVHLALGKLSQPTDELSQNIQTLLQTIGKTRIKKVSLAPTMGPSVKLDLTTI
ncbi:50S ribosomal protein L1 [Candidatus Microgenomates bacterium]|nr:50S ribosomal protein L1 [Candidatus Microgenomates bacterium]